jgi:hypothetical protein
VVLEAAEAARWILAIAAAGIAVASAEDLRRFAIFSDGGLLSWRVLRLTTPSTYKSTIWNWIGRLLRPRVFRAVFLVRLFAAGIVSATAVIGRGERYVLLVGSLVLLVATLLINLRSSGLGLDGAHQMYLLILSHMTVFWLSPADSAIRTWCLAILGFHAVMAYVASGVFKAFGPTWRSGDAIAGIMSAKIYGHHLLGRLLNRHHGLSLLMCWFTIIFEVSFFVVLFSGSTVLYTVLAVGLMFHLTNAVFMGLGGFLFAFVATYPAVVFLNGQSLAIL